MYFLDVSDTLDELLLILNLYHSRWPARKRDILRFSRRWRFDFIWVVTPCGAVVGCQRFRGPCCLCL